MQKRGKRGASQVDWAMSLAIFLLYLSWFFVFVKPILEPERRLTSMTSLIEDGLEDDGEWIVDKVAILLKSDLNTLYNPVIINFPYNWNKSSFAFKDNRYFDLYDGKLMFPANLSSNSTNILYLVHSDSNYTLPNTLSDLIVSEREATNSYFTATFYESKLSKLSFNGGKKINSFKLFQNKDEISITNESFNSTSLSARYNIISGNFNHTTYIFAKSSRIVNFITPEPYQEFNLVVSSQLYQYPRYYSNNLFYGNISYDENECTDITSDYLDFYSSVDGIAFLFDRNVSFHFCYENSTSLELNATVSVTNQTEYWIIPHLGPYDNNSITTMAFYSAQFGLKSEEKGFSTQKLNEISADYDYMKNKWKYPETRDFSINVSNSSEQIWGYKHEDHGLFDNVYVKEIETWILDKNAVQHDVTVRIKTW